ncbi:hypothetical protein OAX34_01470 [Gammaproteobacteria bacterium]|nr:hypothetical protein [Gammaproteobacteria bacterium]
MYKILSIFLIFGIIGCDGASSENTLKPPFINIDECIDYVNKLDAKKGYPIRKKESVINECQGSPNLMISG